MQKPLDFTCPRCGTAYQVLRIQADTYIDAKIDCLVCGQSLQTSDGQSFFKYFLVDPPRLSRQRLSAIHRDETRNRKGAPQ